YVAREHNLRDHAPLRDAHAREDPRATAQYKGHRERDRVDLERTVELKGVRAVLEVELGGARSLRNKSEDGAYLKAEAHAVTKVDGADRRRSDHALFPEHAPEIGAEGDRTSLAIEDGANAAGDGRVIAEIAARRGGVAQREADIPGKADQHR